MEPEDLTSCCLLEAHLEEEELRPPLTGLLSSTSMLSFIH